MEKLPPIKIKTNLKVSQAIPYIELICKLDGLRIRENQNLVFSYNKFLHVLIICEQNGLEYWVKREFRIALHIYSQSIKSN